MIQVNPLVSIIIPVYNGEKTIKKCIESILKQTYRDLELIVVNDGSTDQTVQILQEFQNENKNKIIVINKANEGVSAARNKGIEAARGDYILFVDSDDTIPPDYCNNLMREHAKYSEEVFVWASVETYSEQGNKIEETTLLMDEDAILSRRDVFLLSKSGLLNPPYGKLFIRKILLDKEIRFPKNISIAEDLKFNIDYLDAIGNMRIKVLQDTYYYYVRSPGSLDNRYVENYWDIHKEILDYFKKKADEWGAQDIKLFYERYWDYAFHALYNTMLEQNKELLSDKLAQNNHILKEQEVRKSLQMNRKHIRKREYFFFKYLNYSCYYYFKRLIRRGKRVER